MKLTKIKIDGKVPASFILNNIKAELEVKLASAGFITEVNLGETKSSMKIGLRMRSFSVDTVKLGRNLNSHSGNLTNVPTWAQRVEFNDIVNAVLTSFDVSANVKSGPFTIRHGLTAMVENDWYNQKPDWMHHNESRGFGVESCNEAEIIEKRRIDRNAKAKIKRLAKKQLDALVASGLVEAIA